MSFDPNDEMRPLPWPLTNPRSLGAETDPEDTITQLIWPTADETERVTISLQLSLQEFTALASAIDVGRDIAYNEDSDYVWFLWLRSVIVSICDQIADCITNDVNVQNALQNFLTENGYGGGAGNPNSPQSYEDDITVIDGSTIEDCDNDNLFGAITQLVDLFNDMITDAFEGFEAATGRTERVAAILEGIPLVGLLPFDDILQFADQMLENLAQNYDAQYDAELRDEYRCDLFCAVKDTCELDFQTMADYFFSRAGATFDEVTFAEAVDWFIFGTFSGDLVVHAAHAILCQILAYGSDFFSLSMSWFTKAATSFLNDPDSDWQTLCTECPQDRAYFLSFGDTTLPAWTGTFGNHDAQGMIATTWDGNEKRWRLGLRFDTAQSLRNFKLEWIGGGSGATGTSARLLSSNDDNWESNNNVTLMLTQNEASHDTHEWCREGSAIGGVSRKWWIWEGRMADSVGLECVGLSIKIWDDTVGTDFAPMPSNASEGC